MTYGAAESRVAVTFLAAAAIAVLTLAAPVRFDLSSDGGVVSLNDAAAKNGGGKGGGGKGGGGNGGGKGNAGGKGNGQNANTGPGATRDADDPSLLLVPVDPGVEVAVITTEIRKRYPTDEIASLNNPHKAISFFTELRDLSGTTVMHRWFYQGDVQFEASFNVMSKKWRVWSTQLLPKDKPGKWTVQVLDQNGEILETRTLDYQPLPEKALADKS